MLHTFPSLQFVLSVQQAKEEEEKRVNSEKDRRKLKNTLDPITRSLLTFEDEDDLDHKIDSIFQRLDEDESGGLNFEEFRSNIKQIDKSIHLTRDDYDTLTENGKHLSPDGEFNRMQFKEMMKRELWRYSRRELANVISIRSAEHRRYKLYTLPSLRVCTPWPSK